MKQTTEKLLKKIGLTLNSVIIILILVIIYFLYFINNNLSMEYFTMGAQNSKPVTTRPACPQVYLGPDLGLQNIMEYNDADGDCAINMAELADVCSGDMYETCVSFLRSSERGGGSSEAGTGNHSQTETEPAQAGQNYTQSNQGLKGTINKTSLGYSPVGRKGR